MSHTPLTKYQKALVVQNMGLARRLAMVAWSKNRRQDGDELVSVAFQGLVTAARHFDPTRTEIDPDDLESGKAFAGYARQRISGSLLDWQRKADFVPRRVRKTYKEFQAIGHGDSEITAQALADKTGLPEETVRAVVAAVESMPVSLDDRPDSDEHEVAAVGAMFSMVAAEEDVESDAMVLLICSGLAKTWADLPFLERAAVANKFYYGKSIKQAADAIGCSPTALRKALTAGMTALLSSLRDTAQPH